MREFAGLEELLLAKQDLDGMMTTDLIMVETAEAELAILLPAVEEQLKRRARWLGFRDFPVTHMRHGEFVYVMANVSVPDIGANGERYHRPNVCMGPFQFSHGLEEDATKIVVTGSLLPIRLPQLVARIRIKEEV